MISGVEDPTQWLIVQIDSSSPMRICEIFNVKFNKFWSLSRQVASQVSGH